MILLSSVNFEMSLEISLSGKCFTADIALKRLLASVYPKVYGQVVLLREAAGAVHAAEGLVAGVGSDMCLQLCLAAELLVTLITCMHLFGFRFRPTL